MPRPPPRSRGGREAPQPLAGSTWRPPLGEAAATAPQLLHPRGRPYPGGGTAPGRRRRGSARRGSPEARSGLALAAHADALAHQAADLEFHDLLGGHVDLLERARVLRAPRRPLLDLEDAELAELQAVAL